MDDCRAPHGSHKGFTLVELLVSSAILSILVLVLMNVLNHTGEAWVAGQTQVTQRQDSRVLGDAISQELQSALLPLDLTSKLGLQFTLNPSSNPSIPSSYCNPDALFWQAPAAKDHSMGDIAEIGYFLKWDSTTNPANPRPLLCRFYVDPTDSTNYLIDESPATWLSSAILDAVAPANKTNGYKGLFAENVIGFWVRLYDANGNAISPGASYDSRIECAPPKAADGTTPNPVIPKSVKISLVVIGDNALPRLTSIPDYTTAGTASEPDLDQFIQSLPPGIRSSARAYTTQALLQTFQ